MRKWKEQNNLWWMIQNCYVTSRTHRLLVTLSTGDWKESKQTRKARGACWIKVREWKKKCSQWDWNKMADILQTTFSVVFSLMQNAVFGFKMYWRLFLKVQWRVRWALIQEMALSLQWRHKECDGISNDQHLCCLLNRLFRCRSKKASKLRVTGLCKGNPPVTSGFPFQWASNAKNVSIWLRHHGAKQVASHYYLNQWWSTSLMHMTFHNR